MTRLIPLLLLVVLAGCECAVLPHSDAGRDASTDDVPWCGDMPCVGSLPDSGD